MVNEDVRAKIKAARLYNWEIAQQLSISDATFIRWMRRPLTGEKYRLIMTAIDVLIGKEERKNAGSKSQLG